MTKTTNYQLNQWAKSDRVMMDDFNADNTKIDAALKANADAIAALPRTAAGSFRGNNGTTTITVDFKPKALLFSYNNTAVTSVIDGVNPYGTRLTENGFQMAYHQNAHLNESSVNGK